MQASEPDDIKWKFIGYSAFHRMFTYFVSGLATFLVLITSFVIQIGIQILKTNQIESLEGKPPSLSKTIAIRAISVSSGVFVSISNLLLVTFSMKMSRYEKHLSHSTFMLSHTRKLVMLQFINSGLIAVVMTYLPPNFGQLTNLASYIFTNEVNNLILGPILYFFDPAYFFTLLKRRKIESKLDQKKVVNVTQKELNELFEPEDVTIYLRYTSVIRTFFVSCFFFHVVPSGMFICLIFLIVQFWVDKYMILRRYKITTRYHHNLSYELNEFCEKSILLVALGHLMIKYNTRKEFFIIDILCVVFAVIIIFNPVFEYARHKVNQEMELRQSYKNENMNNSDGQGQHR